MSYPAQSGKSIENKSKMMKDMDLEQIDNFYYIYKHWILRYCQQNDEIWKVKKVLMF